MKVITPKWVLEHEFSFDAAHRLEGLSPGHPCGNIHGHTWRVTVRIQASLLSTVGFVVDFKVVKDICNAHAKLFFDHKFINDVFAMNPTCENIAQYFFRNLQKSLQIETEGDPNLGIHSVTVQETDGNRVTYMEDVING